MTDLTISQLARSAGVGVETVRYYQRRGLLNVPPRPRESRTLGVRRYGASDVERLRFIKSAQASGFTLEQIRGLLSLDAGRNRKEAREMARARIAELDRKIAAMTKARSALRELARQCESGRGRCPIIPAFD